MSRYDSSWSADEIAADMACRQAGREMRTADGLLSPDMDAIFDRLSRKASTQIQPHRPAEAS